MSEVPGNDRLEQGQPVAPRSGGSRRRRGDAASAEAEQAAASPQDEAALATNGNQPPRLLEVYRNEVVPTMMREFNYRNTMEVPRLQKVMLNIGLGEALTNSRAMEFAIRDLTIISGQKPVMTRARRSIAGFKLREGNPIGTSVTLRRARMFHFVDRLFNAALPRTRDFRGTSRSAFDGRGNYSLGVREQIIFPEIDYGQIDRIRGFQVTFVTSARNDTEAARLLELLGMPFARSTG